MRGLHVSGVQRTFGNVAFEQRESGHQAVIRPMEAYSRASRKACRKTQEINALLVLLFKEAWDVCILLKQNCYSSLDRNILVSANAAHCQCT